MRASHRWLCELLDTPPQALDPEHVSAAFTALGLEVEAVQARVAHRPGVHVVRLAHAEHHPERPDLKVCQLHTGAERVQVVAAAATLPPVGRLMVWAAPGAVLPQDRRIEARPFAGLDSAGVLCSEAMLDIGSEEAALWQLPETMAAQVGARIDTLWDLQDHIYDIGLTPNRPDCLGHVGLARELCAGLAQTTTVALPAAPDTSPVPCPVLQGDASAAQLLWHSASTVPPAALPAGAPLNVTVDAKAGCPRYSAAWISGVAAGARAPFWLRYRLHCLGLRALGAVIDLTNYVMLESGQPLHAFDAARLRGGVVQVRQARDGERLRCLDGREVVLHTEDVVISDGEGAIALAGIIGGQDSGITPESREVLLECAYFNPRSIRRTARRLGLHTDASHRFERGVDPAATAGVLARAAAWLPELAGGQLLSPAVDIAHTPFQATTLRYRPERSHKLLGTVIDAERQRGYLQQLGIRVTGAHNPAQADSPAASRPIDGSAPTPAAPADAVEATWHCTVPSWRPDLQREVDLIEEVARLHGYDRLESDLRAVPIAARDAHPGYDERQALRQRAQALGFAECVHFTLISAAERSQARLPEDGPRLANPLSAERAFLRTSLLPGLLSHASRAHSRRILDLQSFEIGPVFAPAPTGADAPIQERFQCALLLSGERQTRFDARAPFDFFDLKGAVASLLPQAPRRALRWRSQQGSSEAWCHPGKSAWLEVATQKLATLGEVHPAVAQAFDLRAPVLVALLDVDVLAALQRAAPVPQLQPLPRFPASLRDIAVVVAEPHPVAALERCMQEASPLLQEVELFDIYRGAGIDSNHRSLAFRCRYRHPERTLTDAEVDAAHTEVTEALTGAFGARVRQ
ncbi:MAG: phenylalanine--tRNA ligase subunit beta [Polyangiales bacterium]